MYEMMDTPAAIIDLDIVEANIRRTAEHNKQYGIQWRPHVKAHKCVALAHMQQELGCHGITCAKVSEALVMARGGIRDIFVAYPLIGQSKLRHLDELLDLCDHVVTLVNSVEGARALSELGVRRGQPIEVLIDIDGGIGRGGLQPGMPALAFAQAIGDLPGIRMTGLMFYEGNIYRCKTDSEIAEAVRRNSETLMETAALLRAHGFDMHVLSMGSSYSARFPEQMQGVTEIRAGNIVFCDNSQLAAGLIRESDCALRVVAQVVSKPDAYHAIIDAGSKALTSDTGAYTKGYGHIVGHDDIEITKLNEEHGFIASQQPLPFSIGDRIEIIPNHACVIPNLNDDVYGVRGGRMDCLLHIDARGMSL